MTVPNTLQNRRALIASLPLRSTALGLFLALVAPLSTAAQTADAAGPPEVGDRVRVTASSLSLNAETGEVVEVDSDGLLVDFGTAGVQPVAWRQMEELEVSEEQRTYGMRGFRIGFAAGAALGAVAGFQEGDDTSGLIAFSAEQKAVIKAVWFGGLGGLVGLALGSGMRSDHWVARSLAPEDEVAGVSVRPSFTGGRPGVSVRLPLGSP